MTTKYQARWISKKQMETLRRSGRLAAGLLVDYYNGFLIVEPVGSHLGDGEVLRRETADYELRSAWCLAPRTKLLKARQLLGLPAEPEASTLAAAI